MQDATRQQACRLLPKGRDCAREGCGFSGMGGPRCRFPTVSDCFKIFQEKRWGGMGTFQVPNSNPAERGQGKIPKSKGSNSNRRLGKGFEEERTEGEGANLAGKDEERTKGTERTKRTPEPGIRAKLNSRLFNGEFFCGAGLSAFRKLLVEIAQGDGGEVLAGQFALPPGAGLPAGGKICEAIII